jgi:hypothetical protein
VLAPAALRFTSAFAPCLVIVSAGCASPDGPAAAAQDGGVSRTTEEEATLDGSADAPRPRCPEPEADHELPDDLFCTGLYAEGAPSSLAPGVRAYTPASEFWSDGADKSRFLALPPGTTIDARDPDEWVFPVGTRAWKELRLGGARIETRLFWKKAPRVWASAAYRWNDAGTSALRMHAGEANVGGTGYEIPGPAECDQCHRGRADRLLGVEAISLGLAGASGTTLADLASEGRLSPPPKATTFTLTRAADDGSPEGTEASARASRAALWLHTNCGISCHNRSPRAAAYYSGFYARLPAAEAAVLVDDADTYTTTVGRAPITAGYEGFERVLAGDPDKSLVYRFATSRNDATMRAMPPIVTHLVDPLGEAALAQWIEGL